MMKKGRCNNLNEIRCKIAEHLNRLFLRKYSGNSMMRNLKQMEFGGVFRIFDFDSRNIHLLQLLTKLFDHILHGAFVTCAEDYPSLAFCVIAVVVFDYKNLMSSYLLLEFRSDNINSNSLQAFQIGNRNVKFFVV